MRAMAVPIGRNQAGLDAAQGNLVQPDAAPRA